MAELPDWMNRTVLRLNHMDSSLAELNTEVRVTFQQDVFIDNSIGWQVQTNAEIIVPAFRFNFEAIREFTQAAGEWLELPIDRLGTVYFAGEWELGESPHRLALCFDRYSQTPSKTDWFSVKVYLSAGDFLWTHDLHVDYTGLALFIEGLSTETFAIH